jgi:beta-1,4-N-acetylglucosaminyltransferase
MTATASADDDVTWTETRRTCLAYSSGGHRAELERALAGIAFTDCFHVTFASGRAGPRGVRVHHLCHPRRSVARTLANAAQALLLLLRERPRVVVTTGADVAVPVLVLGKLLGARTVFVETGGTVAPSLAGRLCYPFSDLFIVQWPDKLRAFPKAVLSRGLLL